MTVSHIRSRERDKHEVEAMATTDALAEAKNMELMHKRMTQLTEIYTTAIGPLLSCADALTDHGYEKEFLDGLKDLCGETFGELTNEAATIRQRIREGQ